MGPALAFLTTVAVFVFVIGLVRNYKGTTAVAATTANGLTNLFTLELGSVPRKQVS